MGEETSLLLNLIVWSDQYADSSEQVTRTLAFARIGETRSLRVVFFTMPERTGADKLLTKAISQLRVTSGENYQETFTTKMMHEMEVWLKEHDGFDKVLTMRFLEELEKWVRAQTKNPGSAFHGFQQEKQNSVEKLRELFK